MVYSKSKRTENDIMAVWTKKKVVLYSLPKIEKFQEYTHFLNSKDDIELSFFMMSTDFPVIIFGMNDGSIKIYNTVKDMNLEANLKAGSSEIINMVQHQNPKVIIAGLAEGKISLINIETYNIIFTYPLQREAKLLRLLSFDSILFTYSGDLHFGVIFWKEKLLSSFGSLNPIAVQKSSIHFCQEEDDLVETFILMNNGSSLIYSLNSNLETESSNGFNEYRHKENYTPKLLYQAPKAKHLLQISKSPFEDDTYFVLSSDSDLLVYKIDQNVAKILYSFEWDQIKDGDGKDNDVKFLNFAFLPYQVGCFDTRNGFFKEEKEEKHRNFILIGCEKGFFIVLDTLKLKTMHSRFNNHRGNITMIEPVLSGDTKLLISACDYMKLKFQRFTRLGVEILREVDITNNPITKIAAHDDWIFLGSEYGDVGIYKYISKNEDYYSCFARKDLPDHRGRITCIEPIPSKKALVTFSDQENKIYIWDYSHKLKIVLVLPEQAEILGLHLINKKGELLICYNSHMTVFDLSTRLNSFNENTDEEPTFDVNLEKFFLNKSSKYSNKTLVGLSPNQSFASDTKKLIKKTGSNASKINQDSQIEELRDFIPKDRKLHEQLKDIRIENEKKRFVSQVKKKPTPDLSWVSAHKLIGYDETALPRDYFNKKTDMSFDNRYQNEIIYIEEDPIESRPVKGINKGYTDYLQQNLRNNYIKKEIEKRFIKNPDFHRIKTIERAILRGMSVSPTKRESNSSYRKVNPNI